MTKRACLDCGMVLPQSVMFCPKCDNDIGAQTDGSTMTVDIAHGGERLRDALRKLNFYITEALEGNAQYLRFIVGNGAIREEVSLSLAALEHRRTIVGFSEDGSNRGALLVRLK